MRGSSRTFFTRGTRRSFSALGAIIGGTLLAIACQNEPLGTGDLAEPAILPSIAAPVACGTGPGDPTNSYHAHVQWACGDTLVFTGVPSGAEGALYGWNFLMNSAVSKAPFLARPGDIPAGSGSHRKAITVSVSGSGANRCGSFDVPSRTISLFNGSCGPIAAVFANELAGIVGYDDGADGLDQGSEFDGHCTRTIPGNNVVVNASVCAHEAEGMLSVYGIRNTSSIAIAQQHILTGYSLSSGNVTLHVGDTLTVAVAGLQFAGANPGIYCGQQQAKGMPGAQLTGGVCTPPKAADVTWDWTTSSGSVAALSGSDTSRVITAGAVGTATITVDVASGPYALYTFINGNGAAATFTVTVTPPPGVPTLVVKSAGDNQSVVVGSAVPTSPKVRVTDYYGTGVSGQSVTFAVMTGGGSATDTATTTDASGYATVGQWTVGTAVGSNTLRATVTGSGISGNPVTFSATAVAITAPSAFHKGGCELILGEAGDTLINVSLVWTAGNAPGWEIGQKTTNDTLSLPLFASGASGTGYLYGPVAPGGFPKGNRYYFIRSVSGTLRSRWIAATGNPINLTTATGCQW